MKAKRITTCFVYFISDGTAIKIGVAVDINQRISQIQTGNPRECYCIASIECSSQESAYKLENCWHDYLGGHHISGEWYEKKPVMDLLNGKVNLTKFNERVLAIAYISFENATVPSGSQFKEEKKVFNGFSEKYLLSGCNSPNTTSEYNARFSQIEKVTKSTSKSVNNANARIVEILSRLVAVENRLNDIESVRSKSGDELHVYYNDECEPGWFNPRFSEKIGGWK